MIMPSQDQTGKADPVAVPKLLGFDVEVGNALYGPKYHGGTGDQASLLLLAAFEGSANPTSAFTSYGTDATVVNRGSRSGGYRCAPPVNCQDWGRKFLPSNGGCAYIDLSHLEICAAEVLSARDYTSMWFAMVTKVSEAVDRINAGLSEPNRIRAFVNNSDGLSHSYGGHLDIMLSRQCYENLFAKRLHYQLFLASHFASSVIYTGQGKVGSENGREEVDYQLSQRADFTEVICGPQTTHRRPLVNSRAEHLVGSEFGNEEDADCPASRYARLHIIFFDSTLTEVSVFLRAGTTALVTAMIEQQQVDSTLILDDPVEAVMRWSHGGPKAEVALASGARYSAMDMQEALLGQARRFVDEGRAEGIVPGAEEILGRWEQVLGLLREDNIDELARHCDWALKYMLLDRAISRQGLDWTSPEIKQLDLLFSSVTPGDGLCWGYRQTDLLEQVVSKGDIERFVHEPPENTRAWLRANLLRVVPDEMIVGVNWDVMRFRLPSSDGFWDRWTLRMDDPLVYTRERCQGLFEQVDSVRDLLLALGARPAYATGTSQGALLLSETAEEDDGETEDADIVYEDS
jgi:Pup amidohydrolase